MKLEEIYEFWNQFHKEDNFDMSEIPEDSIQEKALLASRVMHDIGEGKMLTLFLMFEAKFSFSDFEELSSKINCQSKFAEYLNVKFDENEEGLDTLVSIIAEKHSSELKEMEKEIEK